MPPCLWLPAGVAESVSTAVACVEKLENPGLQQVGMFLHRGGMGVYGARCRLEDNPRCWPWVLPLRFEMKLLIYSGTLPHRPGQPTCKHPPIPASPGCRHTSLCTAFYVHSGDLNSNSYEREGSTLTTEASLQSKNVLECSGSSKALTPYLLASSPKGSGHFLSQKFVEN